MDQAAGWGSRLALFLGTAALLAFVGGPLLAHFGIASPMAGFGLFALGGLLGIAAVIAGLAAAWRGHGLGTGLVAGALVTAVFVTVALPGRRFPSINDITTDTANPPQFVKAQSLPGNAGRDMAYPQSAFASQQQAAYPDLRPLPLHAAADEVFKRVEATARWMPGWEITRDDAAAHTIEGIATSRLFRFKDDFVIEVRAQDDASIVQMRSKSRDGKGDIGANAARIRAFFASCFPPPTPMD